MACVWINDTKFSTNAFSFDISLRMASISVENWIGGWSVIVLMGVGVVA